jgi:hypothetical protein
MRGVSLILLVLAIAPVARAQVIEEDFSKDPNWEGLNNRLVPDPAPVTRQHFGWSNTNHAGGKTKGEVGGYVQRSRTPAYYGMPIKPRSFNEKIRMSGKFAVRRDDGSSGVMFGFFNKNSRTWRTPNSLAMRVDGNGGERGYRLFYEYGSQNFLCGGGGAFEGPRYQTTKTPPMKPDGSSHAFVLEYDPDGAKGQGLIKFAVDDQKYEVALDPGHKADGAVLDRFGIWNVQTTGSGMELYFADLEIDGQPIDLSSDPKWEALGNDIEFPDRVMRPFQDFGFSPTNIAGGKPGELGGVIWRDDKPAYYAARTKPLTLDDELFASGTIAFSAQGSDSDIWFGWFDSTSKKNRLTVESKAPPTDLLGIALGGPSRIGHYFHPGYRDSKGQGVVAEAGPVLRPDGKVHHWTLRYDPKGAGGNGKIEMTLDQDKLEVELKPNGRKTGAKFDRFGLFNVQEGGHHVEVHLDDLKYTAGRQ